VLCGNPAQFQGDERDVIFLSMVDSPRSEGGPLRIRTEELFQQRFNVAARRARDELWGVHSLNQETDLQSLDLRRRLIEHALDPEAITRSLDVALAQTESPFEQRCSVGWLATAIV
jgi:superfamily I DNA and/or RNA helicase